MLDVTVLFQSHPADDYHRGHTIEKHVGVRGILIRNVYSVLGWSLTLTTTRSLATS